MFLLLGIRILPPAVAALRARLACDEARAADDAEEAPCEGDVGVVDAQQRELGVHLARVFGALRQ